jgi:hypothetical protein
MADSATARKRYRKQSPGSNVNLHGDPNLNEVLDAIDQSMDGYLAITLTGDLTLTTTNYTTADQAKRRVHKFTGALTSAAAVTYPSAEGWYLILNAAGAQVTAKCSGGVGVAIPNGYTALVYCDGIDFYNAAPMIFPGALTVAGRISGVTAGTAATDAVNKTQMETALATASLPATAGTLLNSLSDTTAGYASQKLARLGAVFLETINAAGNEQTRIRLRQTATVPVTSAATVERGSITSCSTAGGAFSLNLPPAGSGDTALAIGDFAIVQDVGGACETNNLTITGNAGNINFMGLGAAATLTLDTNFALLFFVWTGAQWVGVGYA